MLKLMKYEFRKSASSKLILLVLTAVFELAFLGGVFFKGYNLMGTGMMFLILCAFFGVLHRTGRYHDTVSGSEQQTKLYAVSDTKEQL